MSPVRELLAAALVVGTFGAASARAAEPAAKPKPPLALPGLRTDEPITVSSRTLEFDYKNNVVVYRGDVQAAQADVHLRSDELTIRLRSADRKDTPKAPPKKEPPAGDATLGGRVQLREVVATGNVRIDQGERWATGGRAVFDEDRRVLVLSEDPVLHDGPNRIAGDRVIVYLDENRSVVEGGDKRVKAVLFPERDAGRGARAGAP
jgi:lipopolysaccharide export system protein LptA